MARNHDDGSLILGCQRLYVYTCATSVTFKNNSMKLVLHPQL